MLDINSLSKDRNFFRYSLYRVLSLSSLGPIFIIVTFILASSPPGREYLGILSITVLVIDLSLEPFFGYVIDIFERKTVLKLCIIATMVLVLLSGILAYLCGITNLAVLSVLLLGGETITSLVFSAQRALQQSVSQIEQMGRNNGIAEITSQLPSMIGSITTIPIVVYIGLYGAIIFAVLTSILSFILLSKIWEREFMDSSAHKFGIKMMIESYHETFRFMKSNFRFTIFVVTLNFTFICLMSANYLSPIYIHEIGGNVQDLAVVEFLYAFFAIVSGTVIPKLSKQKSTIPFIWSFMLVFALGNILVSFYRSIDLFIVIQPVSFGIANPSARVLRNTFVMERIPHEISGKFFSGVGFLSAISRIFIMIFLASTIDIFPMGLLWRINGALVLVGILLSIYLSFRISHSPDLYMNK